MYVTAGIETGIDFCGDIVTEWPRLFEWNFMNNSWTGRCMFDIDGVLCDDPPSENDEAAYVAYIENAIPRYVPTFQVGWICTNPLRTRRKLTQGWLSRYGVNVKHEIIMQPFDTPEERRKISDPVLYKSIEYQKARKEGCILFIESHDAIAKGICEKTAGKPVLSIESMSLFTE